jgi:hypothetical protein
VADGPTVDLNLGPQVQPNSGLLGGNPLDALGHVANLQNTLNQNRLFQSEYAARAKAGQIIANSPDAASAASALQSDPLVMGYHPEIQGAMLNNANALLANQGKISEMSQTALEGIYKGLSVAMADPSQFDSALARGISTVPPAALEYLKAHGDPIGTLKSVWGPLAKSDPEKFKMVVGAAMLPTVAPSNVFGVTGNAPPANVQYPGGGYGQTGGLPKAAPAPAATPVPTPAGSAPVAFDGKPLLAPATSLPPPSKVDSNGIPIRPPEVQQAIDAAGKKFQEDQPAYDAAAQTAARLESVSDDIKTLARGGGWQTPGAGGALRANVANAVNTLSGIFRPGQPPPFDPTKQAAAEDTMKETAQLGFGLVSQAMGAGGHQALGTLNTALSAVPGIENTPLGGMLVADMLKAFSQWLSDKRQYMQDFAQRSNYDLRGAETSFAREHPPSAYVGQVLSKYGLGSEGFASQAGVVNAYRDGLINGKIAYDTLHSKGWISNKAYSAAKAAGFPDQTPQGQ